MARPWHTQIGYLPQDDADELVDAIEEPGPIDHPEPAELQSFVGWIVDDETGVLRPPGSAPAVEPDRSASAPASAPETQKGAAGLRGALRGVLATGLRRLARALD